MRQSLLNGLIDSIDPRRDPRSFTQDERQRYLDAWDAMRRYPEKSTRDELNRYPEIVKLLTTCALCGGPSEGSTHFPDTPDDEFPVCEPCVSKPMVGEFT